VYYTACYFFLKYVVDAKIGLGGTIHCGGYFSGILLLFYIERALLKPWQSNIVNGAFYFNILTFWASLMELWARLLFFWILCLYPFGTTIYWIEKKAFYFSVIIAILSIRHFITFVIDTRSFYCPIELSQLPFRLFFRMVNVVIFNEVYSRPKKTSLFLPLSCITRRLNRVVKKTVTHGSRFQHSP